MRIALALVVVLAASGCGDDGGAQPPAASPPAAPVGLEITVEDGSATEEASLHCANGQTHAGGYLDGGDPIELCSAALDLGTLLTEQPPGDRACTQVFGGPQTAEVSGELDGRSVRRSFSRENGCRISEWDRLAEAGLLPAA